MLAAGDLDQDPPGSVGEFLDQWLAHMRGRVRATTWEGYESLVRHYARPGIGHIGLAELSPLHIQRLYAHLGSSPSVRGRTLSARTIGNLHRVLHRSLGQAVRWQLIGANPAAAAEPPRPRPAELAVVDQSLCSAILAGVAGTSFEAPVAIAIATGMRRGEILGLRWSDFDCEQMVVQVRRSLQQSSLRGLCFEEPKTPRSRRAVALPCFLLPYLERQREDQQARREALGDRWQGAGLVVDAGDGSAWNPDGFSQAWPRVLARAGLPHVRFHDLRHAHATLMLQQGIHPKIVSERLGHSSIGITLDTYSHVLPSMQGEAARAFDRLFQQG